MSHEADLTRKGQSWVSGLLFYWLRGYRQPVLCIPTGKIDMDHLGCFKPLTIWVE